MNQGRRALILFGTPGSGKGTQAQRLSKSLGAPHISTGDILRHHIELGDDLGHEVQGTLKAGILVPDEMVNKLVEQRIDQPDAQTSFILDGYPRTVPQADAMLKMFQGRGIGSLVLHLKVDYNRIIERLSSRRICPVCGTLYSTLRGPGSKPPKIEGICDLDGASLITREDDSAPVIRRRLEDYDQQTKPLVEYFVGHGIPYHQIDGDSGAPDKIAERISALVKAEVKPVVKPVASAVV
jgi:adenylate kinase